MLTVSSATPTGQEPPRVHDSELAERLYALRSMEPLMGKADVKRAETVREISHVEADPLVDALAGFQTVTRHSNVQTLNSTYSILQAMRDCKQLSESVEKRIANNNTSLHKLQADLVDIPRLERSMENVHTSAIKCAELLDSIHAIMDQKKPDSPQEKSKKLSVN